MDWLESVKIKGKIRQLENIKDKSAVSFVALV
jgi:hypothetical protein